MEYLGWLYCLETYVNNWYILSKVCTDNQATISSNRTSKVNKAINYLEKLKIISVALETKNEIADNWWGHRNLDQNNKPF